MTDVLSDTVKESILEQIPLRKFGTTEDVANVVKFLASEDSNYCRSSNKCRWWNVNVERRILVLN